MKRRFRFQYEGNTYSVVVEKKGNEITVEKEGVTYLVTLLPEEEAAGAERAAGIRPESSAAQSPAGEAASSTAQPTSPPGGPNEVSGGSAPSTQSPSAEISVAPGEGLLLAPMTGMIKELKVADGQRVEKGQVVLIMEAMKMDIDVQAPAVGVVAEISVRQGDNVQARQKLMRIE
ncbi:hypothetical protein ES703_96109 [subsurface metagenome]